MLSLALAVVLWKVVNNVRKNTTETIERQRAIIDKKDEIIDKKDETILALREKIHELSYNQKK